MPATRNPASDPFTNTLRPTTTNPALRAQNSSHSLRSNASSAASTRTTRTAHQSTLFAPTAFRRPTSRSTPRVDDGGILADSDSDAENNNNEASVPRPRRRGVGARHGSPMAKGALVEEEPPEFVNRRADGGYLLGVPGVGESVALPEVVEVPKTEEEIEQEEVDAHYASIARQFFASGASLGGRSSRKHEEELGQLQLPMMMRLREQVTEKLEGERWQYESVDRFQTRM